jgi:hypothetical protein
MNEDLLRTSYETALSRLNDAVPQQISSDWQGGGGTTPCRPDFASPTCKANFVAALQKKPEVGKNKVVPERNLFVVKTLVLVSSSFKTAEQQYVS